MTHNEIRRTFVTRLAYQLNRTVDYRHQTFCWLCLLMSPFYASVALLILSGFVSHALLFGVMAVLSGVYLCIYLRLVADNFVITRECMSKVLRKNPGVYQTLLATAREEWTDADTERTKSSYGGGCGCSRD